MTTVSATEEMKAPLRSDAEIVERVDALIGRACRRQWWLIFLDDHGVQLEIVMPIENYPESPTNGNAEQFASAIQMVISQTDAEQVIFVWERYGPPESTRADRTWARTLGGACLELRVPVRGQLLSHNEGVRWLPTDEYLS